MPFLTPFHIIREVTQKSSFQKFKIYTKKIYIYKSERILELSLPKLQKYDVHLSMSKNQLKINYPQGIKTTVLNNKRNKKINIKPVLIITQ